MIDVLKEKKYDITCVLVFDGKPPLLKGRNRAGRRYIMCFLCLFLQLIYGISSHVALIFVEFDI